MLFCEHSHSWLSDLRYREWASLTREILTTDTPRTPLTSTTRYITRYITAFVIRNTIMIRISQTSVPTYAICYCHSLSSRLGVEIVKKRMTKEYDLDHRRTIVRKKKESRAGLIALLKRELL